MTFRELAEYILTLPDKVQDSEASFVDLVEGDEVVTLGNENVGVTRIIEDDFAPMIFGAPCAFYAIATSNEEIDEEYKHFAY